MNDNILKQLSETIESRANSNNPSESYVASLLHKGQDAILKKIGEESTELVIASKNNDTQNIIYECADVWFHTAVLLQHHGLSTDNVLQELARRFNLSGLTEKANRL
jgi:phosphoribosyl-ATP pyrophosphohydrolase